MCALIFAHHFGLEVVPEHFPSLECAENGNHFGSVGRGNVIVMPEIIGECSSIVEAICSIVLITIVG